MESEASSIPDQNRNETEKVDGYLDIKVPASSRGRRILKAWKRRWIEVTKSSGKVTLRIYISDSAVSKEEPPLHKKEINPKLAVIFRSQSKTHNYAFTIAEDKEMILHFSASSETESQEWMENLRNILWPPSDVLLLEKVFSGVYEVSIIDNEFTKRAGLLGAYGYLRITDKKFILTDPHIGHVIQEWYLNSLRRFQLLPASRKEDKNRLFSIETGSDSSTGKGTMCFFSKEALQIMQSVGSTIQQLLQTRKKQAKTKAEIQQYRKDLEELELCLRLPEENNVTEEEEHYQVPRREIRSVLDIPNFTFNRPLSDYSPEYRRKEQVGAQRHSCPEMSYHVATKANNLSLDIPEDIPLHTESPNETTDATVAKDPSHEFYQEGKNSESMEIEKEIIPRVEENVAETVLSTTEEHLSQTQASNNNETSMAKENVSPLPEKIL